MRRDDVLHFEHSAPWNKLVNELDNVAKNIDQRDHWWVANVYGLRLLNQRRETISEADRSDLDIMTGVWQKFRIIRSYLQSDDVFGNICLRHVKIRDLLFQSDEDHTVRYFTSLYLAASGTWLNDLDREAMCDFATASFVMNIEYSDSIRIFRETSSEPRRHLA